MSFLKKSFLSRVVETLQDTEKLKSPVVMKHGNSLDTEIARLQKELEKPEADVKKIEQHIKYMEIGKAGEQALLFELTNSFLPMMILHDVYIEHNGFNAQFDFIVITRQFFLVIEVKKYYGNVTVNEKGEFIRTVKRGSRTVFEEGMYSPIRQVERQVEVLRSMLIDHEIIEQTQIRYAVAFANERTVIDLKKAPLDIQDKVVRSDGIVPFLKSELTKKSPVHFRDKRMQGYAEYIKSQHVDKYKAEIFKEEEKPFFTEEEVFVVKKDTESLSDEGLEESLKAFRKKLADESGRKAFYIFTNKTLDELIEKKPTTLEALRNISGIGDKKIEEFGADLLQLIEKN